MNDRPPIIVGYEHIPFIVYEENSPRLFVCPMHAHRYAFPTRYEPVWRGEVPAGAECETCGIELSELE